jgi:broad specificity phosphatase PhoE
MTIPVSLLDDLEHVLRDRPSGPPGRVALLMRHSARFPIENPADTYRIGLTEEGVRMAEELGVLLGKRFLPGRLRSSPVGRCRATAEAIARGAGWMETVRADRRLSHPYNDLAWELVWRTQTGKANGSNGTLPAPLPEVLRWVIDRKSVTSIFRPLRQDYLPLFEPRPVLDVLVTHDTVVGAVAGALLHASITGPDWPGFLEGLLFWWIGGQVHVLWRGVEHLFYPDFSRIPNQ